MPKLNAANIKAIEQIYAAAMMEELQFFNVMDRLVMLFHSGVLPIKSNAMGERLYTYWKQQARRLSPNERKNLYYRTLGLGRGDSEIKPNQEFNKLWRQFVSAAAQARGPVKIDPTPRRVGQEAVRKAGRDLAANLSFHGQGFACFAALDLQAQIKTIAQVLSAPDVRSAYGARSIWEVIEEVAASDLGVSPNTGRYRTMAEAGAIIIAWLAGKARGLAEESARPILGNQLSDRRMIEACEQWLLADEPPETALQTSPRKKPARPR